MISPSAFHHRPSAIVRAIALCALLLVIALAATIAVTSRSAARARQLSFEDRVAAQRAVEAVYHRHRLWPTDKCAAQTSARRSSAIQPYGQVVK
ncbi:MAG: hypothetical protein ACREBD_25570 [Blastocatellia bacterium]